MNSPVKIHADSERGFNLSCVHNHLEVAQWLIYLGVITNSPINFHANRDLLSRVCEVGHLEMAQWLYQISMEAKFPFDIHKDDEQIFRASCTYGHLEMAQWLYHLSIKINPPINIHINNDTAFQQSCARGHLKVAQWLYRLSIEINSPIDINNIQSVCCISFTNSNIEVLKWLLQFEQNNPISEIHNWLTQVNPGTDMLSRTELINEFTKKFMH